MPQLNDEMRNKIVYKILGMYKSEELFNEDLSLDINEAVLRLKELSDEQLINLIIDSDL